MNDAGAFFCGLFAGIGIGVLLGAIITVAFEMRRHRLAVAATRAYLDDTSKRRTARLLRALRGTVR